MTRSWLHERFVDDDRWKPFAWSAGITLLVVGVHTGRSTPSCCWS